MNDPFSSGVPYEFQTIGEGVANARFTQDEDGPALCYYGFNNILEGSVKFVNIDRTNFIVSGEFEFSTAVPECDTLKVTSGRFDLQYIP